MGEKVAEKTEEKIYCNKNKRDPLNLLSLAVLVPQVTAHSGPFTHSHSRHSITNTPNGHAKTRTLHMPHRPVFPDLTWLWLERTALGVCKYAQKVKLHGFLQQGYLIRSYFSSSLRESCPFPSPSPSLHKKPQMQTSAGRALRGRRK